MYKKTSIQYIIFFISTICFAILMGGCSSAFEKAVKEGDLETTKQLIEGENELNISTEKIGSQSPILVATRKGHIDIVKLLIENGADVNAKSSDSLTWSQGWTALISASENGDFNIAKLLIENGADVNASSKSGWTAIMSASRGGYFSIVKLLVENGADVNAISEIGWTPVRAAAYYGYAKRYVDRENEEIVKFLVRNGADILVENGNIVIFLPSSLSVEVKSIIYPYE